MFGNRTFKVLSNLSKTFGAQVSTAIILITLLLVFLPVTTVLAIPVLPTRNVPSTTSLDTTNPTVTSITRLTPPTSPTDADTLTFRVTFSEAVKNVDNTNFATSSTAPGCGCLVGWDGVTGGPSVYNVTVKSHTGGNLESFNGTVELLVGSDTPSTDITDLAGNPLLSGTPTGANETYQLINTSVPLFLQTNPIWANNIYGNNGGATDTIKRWGCWMTSAAMIINFWGQKSSPPFQTNPGNLNTWLRNNKGYDGGLVVHAAITKYASVNNVSLYYKGLISGRNDAVLDDYVTSGNPVIIGVDLRPNSKGVLVPNHWVVATGKTTVGSQSTYSINDPIYGITTLLDKWSNNYSNIVLFSGTPADPRTLRISAHSPVELLVTDPLGRKSGFDPTTNTTWNEIPNAIYVEQSLAPDDGSSVPALENKFLDISSPLDGDYVIEMIGTGEGPYEIDSFASDLSGNIYTNAYTGVAQNNSVDTHIISFNSSTGIRIFADVLDGYWATSWIERLYNAGITGGCSNSPLMYCPEATVTRAQMAIFILRGIHGSAYTPPAATGAVFGDVPAGSFAADWIEQLAAEGVTAGCGGGNYCPDATITRAQMAIFLLRGEHGSAYTPPTGTGAVFGDVPAGSFAADWIEQLAAEGITSGCGGGNYCPNANVTRAEMAVFLVRAFHLP